MILRAIQAYLTPAAPVERYAERCQSNPTIWRAIRYRALLRGRALYGVFDVKRFLLASSVESIAAIATGWIDVGQGVEVEVCDGLQSLSCWGGAKAVGKRVEPCNIFGLEGGQFADGIAPALRTAASIGRPAVSDHGHRHTVVLARPIARELAGSSGLLPASRRIRLQRTLQ